MDILCGRSVRDQRHIYTFRGFSADSSTFCCPVKLPPPALGFCSNIVKQEDLNPDFISGPTELPPAMLIGSKWEGMHNMFFESSSCAWFYPSGAAPQYGALTDHNFGETFDKITANAKKWTQHVVDSFHDKPSLDKIYQLITDLRRHTSPPGTILLCGTPRLPPSNSYRFYLARLRWLSTVYQQRCICHCGPKFWQSVPPRKPLVRMCEYYLFFGFSCTRECGNEHIKFDDIFDPEDKRKIEQFIAQQNGAMSFD